MRGTERACKGSADGKELFQIETFRITREAYVAAAKDEPRTNVIRVIFFVLLQKTVSLFQKTF